ncbi:MAG: hypothetical protein IT289_02230 [Oligoflexia bacterium]|nr:hypothetical protein [Oligoflexia bacterium]
MTNKTKTALIVGVIAILIVAVILFIFRKEDVIVRTDKAWVTTNKSGPCPAGETIEVLKDYAMAPVLKMGQKFKVVENYYGCNPLKRGDLVYFRFSPQESPVVRKVMGIPVDKFGVRMGKTKMDWRAIINGEVAKTPAGEEYQFGSDRGNPVLSLYIESRKGILQENEIILFAAVPSAHITAGTMGISSMVDVVGKVFPIDEEEPEVETAKEESTLTEEAGVAPVATPVEKVKENLDKQVIQKKSVKPRAAVNPGRGPLPKKAPKGPPAAQKKK